MYNEQDTFDQRQADGQKSVEKADEDDNSDGKKGSVPASRQAISICIKVHREDSDC